MNCNNATLMDKIGLNKLNKLHEIRLSVLNNLPDCKKVRANKFVKIANDDGTEVDTTSTFNRFLVPDNQFECMREGCVNSGTLYPNNADGNVIYRLPFDAVEFSSGVATFYVTGFDGAQTVTVKMSTTDDFANADVYEVPVTGKGADFVPVVVDLSQTPTSVVGNGWEASRSGAYISIKVPDANAGISSISIFDSMADFATSDVVTIGCLTEISADEAVEAAEATCWSSGYDTSSESPIEITVTGNSVTPNWWKLNPRYGKGEATVGWKSRNAEFTVEADGDYGKITLTDMNQDVCDFLGAQITGDCDITGSLLERLTVPTKIKLNANQFNAINNEDGTTDLFFNNTLVGNTVKVTYPQLKDDVQELIASDENIGNVRVRLEEIVEQNDGVTRVHVYDNVLVTSFPHTINEEETEFSFTLTIQRGANGHMYRTYIIGQ